MLGGLTLVVVGFTITAPTQNQIKQRSGTTGSITAAGAVGDGTHTIECRFNGGTYVTVGTNVTTSFGGTVSSQAQGQGQFECRQNDSGTIGYKVNIPLVGIGDVYAIAGQSNAEGKAPTNQSCPAGSGMFGNDYLWKACADPTDDATNQVDTVSKDTDAAGSYWPTMLVDLAGLASLTGIPLAIIPCAKGSTAISQWVPGGSGHFDRSTLYGSCANRIQTVGGVRAVLWHQGESDMVLQTAQATYSANLTTIANAFFADVAAPLMPAKLQVYGVAGYSAIQAAIAASWGTGHILTGPDLSSNVDCTQASQCSDNTHLSSAGAISNAGSDWELAIKTAFGL